MNKSYKKIPEILIGKTIAFTGSFPGVGKSYTYSELVKQLTFHNYRVIVGSSTQKAAANIDGRTVASISWKYTGRDEQGNPIFIDDKNHPKISAFYLIDEAFMMDQTQIDRLKHQYPQCCFVLFGDPMQFYPATDESPIMDIDLLFSLEKMMRVKDESLLNAIIDVKNGKLPEKFMYTHSANDQDDSMVLLCYEQDTRDFYNSLFEDYKIETIYRSYKHGNYTDSTGEQRFSFLDEVSNGELWKLVEMSDKTYTLRRISGYQKDIEVDFDTFKANFVKSNANNCHKVQGDTIRQDTDIIICFDEMFTPENIKNHPQTLLRFLYVALSRAEYSKQIHFWFEQLSPIISSYKNTEVLYDYLKDVKKIITSSPELCTSDILSDFILPNIQGGNVDPIPHIKYSELDPDFPHNFGYGKNQNYLGYAQLHGDNISVITDQKIYRKLEKELNNRKIQELPGKGKCFITINNTVNGRNESSKVTEYNWFVFEIDSFGKREASKEEIEKLFINNGHKALQCPEAKKHSFRIVYSGRRSYHFWIYVDNEELNTVHSRDFYKAVWYYLNSVLFNNWADDQVAQPEKYVRAPGVIRPDTNTEQKLVSFKGHHIVHINNIMQLLPKKQEIQISVSVGGEVEQAFNIYKDDIPTVNGGRGKIILEKLRKEHDRGYLNNDQLKELATMLCEQGNCPEKIKHMFSYIDKM